MIIIDDLGRKWFKFKYRFRCVGSKIIWKEQEFGSNFFKIIISSVEYKMYANVQIRLNSIFGTFLEHLKESKEKG